jgi:hypothetical protein
LILNWSDGWSDRPDVVQGLEREAVGGISVRIYSPYVADFDEYYFNLNPINNTRNPWFKEFWELRSNCSLKNITGTVIKHPSGKVFTKMCTGLSITFSFWIIEINHRLKYSILNSIQRRRQNFDISSLFSQLSNITHICNSWSYLKHKLVEIKHLNWLTPQQYSLKITLNLFSILYSEKFSLSLSLSL